MKGKAQIIFLTVNPVLIWFALILQFVISVNAYEDAGRTFAGAMIQILSFFTIQTNILVAVSMTAILLAPASRIGRFFARPAVLAAITVYILIVGLVYAVALKGIWHAEGWFKLADTLLHEWSPLAFLMFWLFLTPKEPLPWICLVSWAVFPFLYLVYSLCRGALTGDYPYPFLEVSKLGYVKVLINSSLVLLVFVVVSGLVVGMSRLVNRSH